jgi:flagellar operon protein
MGNPSINQITPGIPATTAVDSPARSSVRGRDTEFAQVLSDRLNSRSIALSVHAADRLVRRGLLIDEQAVEQINEAFGLAEEKGAKNALFLLDNLAVVASVPNRSIITALDANGLSNGVFTQIDSAVVLHRDATENENETING